MDTNLDFTTSLDELVFEQRNKEYGAYQIRRSYGRNLMKAVLIATSIFGAALGAYFINKHEVVMSNTPKEEPKIKIIPVTLDQKKDQPKEIIKPKLNPPPKGPDKPDMSNIVVVKDSVRPPQTTDSLGASSKGKVGGTGLATNDTTGTPCINCDSIKKTIVVVDHLKNGENPKDPGLDAFFSKNIKYPVMAREQGIEGTVWLSFIVDTKGNVRDITIIKGANPMLDKEVLRVAKFMPKWEPVVEDGELVEFLYRKPVRFVLQK